MTELERTRHLERQLRSANRWLTLALLFIKLACLLMGVAIILVVLHNRHWQPTLVVSLMLALLSYYCKWAAGRPGSNQ